MFYFLLSILEYRILWPPTANNNVTPAVCGGLNENGSYKLIDLSAWSPKNGTIGKD